MNYYQTLQIKKTATQEEVKQAYRRLAKQFHPDKNPGDESAKLKFQQIQEAYSVLGEESKRFNYDQQQDGNYGNLADLFRNWASGSNFSEDFDAHFGGFRNNPNAKGQDVRIHMQLTVKEIYTGTSKIVDTGSGPFEIKIPKGAREGAKYKMTGMGRANPFNSSAPSGDLIIHITIQYDENLIIQGDDIMMEAYINFYDMIIGTSLDVVLPDNTKISVKIPAKTNPGKVLRVSGKGLPIFNSSHAGALLIKVNTHFQNITEDQLFLINKIKEMSNA